MKKNKNLNIFDKNIKNDYKLIPLNTKKSDLGKIKYLSPYFKEWNHTIYSFYKNDIKNISSNNILINNLIKTFFNLYLIKYKDIFSKKNYPFLKDIHISKVEIKYNNSIAMITLYTVNLRKYLFTRYINYFYYYSIIKKWSKVLNKKERKKIWIKQKPYSLTKFLEKRLLNFVIIRKSFTQYLNYTYLDKNNKLKKILNIRFKLLRNGIESYNLYKKIYLIKEIKYLYYKYLIVLYKYNYQYLFNNIKFKEENSSFINKLKYKISLILNKKVEFNIINLKSITYHTDIFTNLLAMKLKENNPKLVKNILTILNKGKVIKNTELLKKTLLINNNKSKKLLKNTYKNSNLISILSKNSFNSFLKNTYNSKSIFNTIFNLIRYKNIGGIRLETKGRLTRRYRADRAIYKIYWKGGLKNLDTSFLKLPSSINRGHLNSNIAYSISRNKRRIGSFAIKGWISGR